MQVCSRRLLAQHHLSRVTAVFSTHQSINKQSLHDTCTMPDQKHAPGAGESDSQGAQDKYDQEKAINRNPHGNFKDVEASRDKFAHDRQWNYQQTPNTAWKLGDGAHDGGESLKKSHVCIDPYAQGRPAVNNYKLLISAIVPRPVGFVSTRSLDGK